MGNQRGQCSRGDNCSFRHEMNKRGKVTPSNPSPNSVMQQNVRKASRTRSPRGKSPSGRMSRWPCKDYLTGSCNNSFCEKWHSRMLVLQDQEWLILVKSARMHIVRLMGGPKRGSKKNDDKSAAAMLKKNDWHENVREPVVKRDKNHERSGRPDMNRDHELKRGPTGRRSSRARHLGCVFQDMKPPKSI